jgi:ferredoxin-NADP reductase
MDMDNVLVRCLDSYPATETVSLYKFKLPHGTQAIDIGQHVTLAACDDSGLNPGTYTVVDKQNDGTFSVAIKKTGRNTLADRLHAARNLRLRLQGISGTSVPPAPQMLLLCGGVGITPAIAVLRQRNSVYKDCDIQVVMSAESLSDLPFLPELLDSHFSEEKVRLNIFITRAPIAKRAAFIASGRINAASLQQICPDLPARKVHIFGSESFVRAMQRIVQISAPETADRHVSNGTVRIGARSFKHSGKETLLELLEREGIPIRTRCRMGICGSCKVTLRQGQVISDDAVLSQVERDCGIVLACCSVPVGNVQVEV